MKTTLSFVLLLASSANGFSAPGVGKATRPDTSGLVEEALKTTAAFGIDSKEARVAWDVVEEMDASDNSEATHASLDKECSVEDTSIECMDYSRFLDELYTLRALIGEKGPNKKKSLAETLKLIRMEQPKSAKAASSDKLATALEEAKVATEQHGVTSPEARLAWETYEDIAASGLDNAVGINLLEECDIEAGQDACKAMEEMNRVLPVLLAITDPSK